MRSLPHHEVVVYHNGDVLPQEAQDLFAVPLANSRRPLPEDRWDRNEWCFALTCAVTSDGHVLGGVHLDIGPIGGEGPLARRKLAYLERTLVRPEYRRRGREETRYRLRHLCEFIRQCDGYRRGMTNGAQESVPRRMTGRRSLRRPGGRGPELPRRPCGPSP